MFPQLKQRLLAKVDLLVEFSTLGEYGVDEHGAVMTLDAQPTPMPLAPRVRDRCAGGNEPRSCATALGRAAQARP